MAKGTIQAAKIEIQRLISSYEDLKKKPEKYKSFTEDDTCRVFLLPLFNALGWDTESKERPDEVKSQKEAGGRKRVDYSFNISGSSVLFLEAKQLSADLYDSQYVDQAINYGINKGVKFVVLSDFEGLMVFNCLVKRKRPQEKKVIELKYTEYLSKLDVLWLLSRDSIANNKLNEYAEKLGHLENRAPINDILLQKFLKWRDKLIRQISSDNSYLTKEDVAECVQKLLNRLIFIRTCEDRQIEEGYHLRNLLKEWQSDSSKRLHEMLRNVYDDFNEGYNSNLFAKHELDKIKISDDLLYDIIRGLYEDQKEDIDKIDFEAIDADILGSIYEQYLGTIQKEHGDNTKRKSQGIYYTPKYIVDYIVKNTLGKVIDDLIRNKEYSKISKLKVLDPACGSGSFLLNALQVFDEAYAKTPEDKDYPKMRKIKALKLNIYGVDLDEEAAELTKLNLLLSAVSARMKLPNLDHNIECGNSLIDDPKVAGDKAFDWKKRFPEVMDKGNGSGFDVIIGNPPYIFARGGNFPEHIKQYYYNKYKLAGYQLNTYLLFIDLAYNMLKEGAYLGFIVPNTWLTIDTFSQLRKFMLKHSGDLQIINIYDKVFQAANVDTCLLLFRKTSPSKVTLGEFRDGELNIFDKFSPSKFKDNKYIINISLTKSKNKSHLLNKINASSKMLNKYATVSTGIKAYQVGKGRPKQTEGVKASRKFHSTKKLNKSYIEYLTGSDVGRYCLGWSGEYISFGDWLAEPRKSVPFEKERILIRQIPSLPPYSINGVFTDKYYINDINSMVIFDFKVNPLYLLAVLNSRVTSFWFVNTFDKFQRKIFPQFKVKELAVFPIPLASKDDQKMISKKAKIMLDLKGRFEKVRDKQTSETERLKRQIEETDKEIDGLVFRLYGLTKEEIAVVEGEK